MAPSNSEGDHHMASDLIEDLAAFAYITRSIRENVCPVCGADLEEKNDGDLYCPECDN